MDKCNKCGSFNIIVSPLNDFYFCLSCMAEYKTNEILTEFTTTATNNILCEHTGYIYTIKFLIFKKKFLVCEKCHELIEYGKWKIKQEL